MPLQRMRSGDEWLALGQNRGGRLRQFVERPQAQRRVIASQRRGGHCGNLPHTARDAHIVHQAIATDAVFNRPPDSQISRHCIPCSRRKRLLFHHFAVHEKPHAFLLEHNREVMPRIVANRRAASHLAALPWQIRGKITLARV